MSDTDDLRSLLKRIMTSNEHSDITISCGAYNHRVYRAIISAQSEVLAAMCNANFLEGKTGKISLPDDDPEAIYMMVQHLYGQSYKDTRLGLKDYGEGRALLNLNVYASADKYNIPSLEECAKEEFKDWAWRSQCTESWGHVVEEAWKGNEFSGLHLIIEKQIAEDIDPMLKDDWLPFIDKGMKLGRLSAAFLRHIVEKKNGIFYALRDTEKGYERDIIDLKKKDQGLQIYPRAAWKRDEIRCLRLR